MFFETLLYAGTTAKQPGLQDFMPLIFIFVIFYFLLIRPQQKQAKEHLKMLGALKKGNKIVTSGGIIGIIESIEEKEIVISTGSNTNMRLTKNSVSSIYPAAGIKK
ncbi:MAG: preprotein translocase subunit YajC [Candidatus Omnitrophota bacterium]|nr:preprotein translocase subunit YajC [Candidatus Omnitrophota bacterium]MBU2528269.1 preprotein translocase subunit YajC [bacterium]MBU3929646.1 preprotein translocase subunit YajC [bacterium]MBU4122130.1 preprotein translocase subunit YajC [bacterium]